MGSENPEDFGPAVSLAEEDQQEIGGLINSDGEEVDFSDLSEWINRKNKFCTERRERQSPIYAVIKSKIPVV